MSTLASKNLKTKSFSAGRWVVISHLISQIIRFGGNLLMTRLLVPEMFGVMSVVMVFMIGLSMMTDVGLTQNIIQSKRGEQRDFLNTAWTIQVIRGGVIFGLVVLCSIGLNLLGESGQLPSQTAIGNPQLPLVLAVMSVTALTTGFSSIYLSVLNRQLQMAKLVSIELISQVAGLLLMLTWAWFNRDIWALVYGALFASTLRMLMSHSRYIGQSCQWAWDKSSALEIFHFGKWIFLASIFGFLLNQGDRLLLGGMISAKDLGIYSIAFFLATAITEVLSKLVSMVFYPMISEVIRENSEKLPSIYYKLRNRVDFLTLFIAGFVFIYGETMVSFLYDERYQNAGWMLEFLGLTVIASGFLIAEQCLLAYGHSNLFFKLIFVQVVSLFIMLPVFFNFWGMQGAIAAIVLAALVRVVTVSFLMKKHLFWNGFQEIKMLPVVFIGMLFGWLLCLI